MVQQAQYSLEGGFIYSTCSCIAKCTHSGDLHKTLLRISIIRCFHQPYFTVLPYMESTYSYQPLRPTHAYTFQHATCHPSPPPVRRPPTPARYGSELGPPLSTCPCGVVRRRRLNEAKSLRTPRLRSAVSNACATQPLTSYLSKQPLPQYGSAPTDSL